MTANGLKPERRTAFDRDADLDGIGSVGIDASLALAEARSWKNGRPTAPKRPGLASDQPRSLKNSFSPATSRAESFGPPRSARQTSPCVSSPAVVMLTDTTSCVVRIHLDANLADAIGAVLTSTRITGLK